MLVLGDAGFCLEVEVATTRRARLMGLIGTEPYPLLLRTASVHGFGLRRRIQVIAIDAGGRVIASRVLRRRHIVTVPSARWILELPTDIDPPLLGERLVLDASRRQAGPHGIDSVSVRDADRQPR